MKTDAALPLTLLLSLGLLLPTAGSAQSQRNKIDGIRPEVHGTVGWGLGVGGRIDIPVVSEGFLDNRMDEFVISPGVDFFFYDFSRNGYCWRQGGDVICEAGYNRAGFVASIQTVAQWNLHVNDEWSFFPEAGLALSIGDHYSYHHPRYGDWDPAYDGDVHVHIEAVVGGGARWHFSRRNALVMRAIWPYGFQLGITF